MNDRFKLEEKDRDNTTKQRKTLPFPLALYNFQIAVVSYHGPLRKS